MFIQNRIKVLHLITSLDAGGAERVLSNLVTIANRNKFEHVVISIKNLGFYGPRLIDQQIKVYTLNVSKLKPWRIFKICSVLQAQKPDIIHSWLYHADLATVIPYLCGYKNILWNIRNNQLSWATSPTLTIIVRKLCAWLSFIIPKQIVCCSIAAANEHIRIGYKPDKFITISNGYDITRFAPSANTRDLLRKELGILSSEIIIGNVGRYDPAKDHITLFKALSQVRLFGPNIKVLLIGKNINWENKELVGLVKIAKLEQQIILLPEQHEIEKYYNIMDIFVLSSRFEAFPNVVAEAMACAVPCVVTDVGDAALIVGDTGFIVPPVNHVLLADGILHMLNLKQDELKQRRCMARERIKHNFGLNQMIDKYEQLYLH